MTLLTRTQSKPATVNGLQAKRLPKMGLKENTDLGRV